MKPGPNLGSDIVVAGVGMHPFGKFPDASLKDLARVAIVRALVDASVGTKDIDAIYASNALAGVLQGQEQIRGQTVMRDVGLERVPVVNVENACASGSTALREAIVAVHAGVADVALVVGYEKMFVDDRDRSLDALESAADIEIVGGLGLQFTAVYAMRLRKRIDAGLLSHEDLVSVSVKSHRNASLNPMAHHQKAFGAAEIRGSRPVADPLTLLMCSSISDGAAAAVVMRKQRLRSAGRPTIAVRASAAVSGFSPGNEEDRSVAAACAQSAYEQAGIGPSEINVAEVHDAMAPAELLYYEQLGLCEPGRASDLLRTGATAIGGRIAVNPSGGLCSRGHPVGATGLAQVAELVWQLRGEAGGRQTNRPRMALAQNSGGWFDGESAACNVHIFERVDRWH